MSKFLISFYPIEPWRSFLCCEINNEINTRDAKELLEEYYRGLEKHGRNEGDFCYLNNSWWQLIEAESIFTAMDKFRTNLENWWKEAKR